MNHILKDALELFIMILQEPSFWVILEHYAMRCFKMLQKIPIWWILKFSTNPWWDFGVFLIIFFDAFVCFNEGCPHKVVVFWLLYTFFQTSWSFSQIFVKFWGKLEKNMSKFARIWQILNTSTTSTT